MEVGRRRDRVWLVAALIVSLAGATYSHWIDGDWLLLSRPGIELLHPHALHVYADNYGLQAGPPSLLLIGVLALAGKSVGATAIHVVLWLIGAAIIWLAATSRPPGTARGDDRVHLHLPALITVALMPLVVTEVSRRVVPAPLSTLVLACLGLLLWRSHASAGAGQGRSVTAPRWVWVALLALPCWSLLAAQWLHLDDGLALLAMVIGLRCTLRDRRLAAAVAIGAAIAFKPWAIAALPLVLRRNDRTHVVRDAAIALLIPAACWAPFLLADRGTLREAHIAFRIDAMSTVHLLGLHDPVAPAWLRPLQLAMILVFAALGARRGPTQALVCGMVARLLFDFSVVNYYVAGLVAVVAVADIVRRQPAWRTGLVLAGLWLIPSLNSFSAGTLGVCRALTLVGLLAGELLPLAVVARVSQSRLWRGESTPRSGWPISPGCDGSVTASTATTPSR